VASAINAAVAGSPLVTDAAESMKSALNLDMATKAIEMYGQVKSVIAGGPAALLQTPPGKQLLGAVMTNPITGSVTGKDIAGLLSAGDQAGIFHLGKVGSAVTGAVGEGAALPKDVQQFMALRTEAAAPELDGNSVNNAIAQNIALGYTPLDARAVALEQHGVAMYQGNGAGIFSKMVPSLPVG
jgi:hypothetical protein